LLGAEHDIGEVDECENGGRNDKEIHVTSPLQRLIVSNTAHNSAKTNRPTPNNSDHIMAISPRSNFLVELSQVASKLGVKTWRAPVNIL
jgi:hypothetical protein